MKRKLVTIQKVSKLEPIEGADFIEKATVMGWNVVVKKGEFKEGDKCCFFEIDSLLPSGPEWSAFMEKVKFRVKTCKLRGVLSQGLALPTSVLPGSDLLEEGTEVTDELGVTKWEPPTKLAPNAKGNFPSFIPKTDEIRLQSAMGVIEEINAVDCYISLKMDGSSLTAFMQDGELGVCSRNLMLKEEDSAFWRVVNRYKLKEKLREGMAIQGELCGPGIQGNKLNLKEHDLFVFNLFNIKEGKYMGFYDMHTCVLNMGLKLVPLLKPPEEPLTLESLLELARGKYEGTQNHREGLVVRPVHETYSPTLGGRLSFKVINNDYLLKEK